MAAIVTSAFFQNIIWKLSKIEDKLINSGEFDLAYDVNELINYLEKCK